MIRLFHVNSLFRITSTLQNVPGSQEKKIKKRGSEKKVSYIAKCGIQEMHCDLLQTPLEAFHMSISLRQPIEGKLKRKIIEPKS